MTSIAEARERLTEECANVGYPVRIGESESDTRIRNVLAMRTLLDALSQAEGVIDGLLNASALQSSMIHCGEMFSTKSANQVAQAREAGDTFLASLKEKK